MGGVLCVGGGVRSRVRWGEVGVESGIGEGGVEVEKEGGGGAKRDGQRERRGVVAEGHIHPFPE